MNCMWWHVRIEEYVAPDQQVFDLHGQSFEGQLEQAEQAPESTEQLVFQEQGKCPWPYWSYTKDIVFTTCMLVSIEYLW